MIRRGLARLGRWPGLNGAEHWKCRRRASELPSFGALFALFCPRRVTEPRAQGDQPRPRRREAAGRPCRLTLDALEGEGHSQGERHLDSVRTLRRRLQILCHDAPGRLVAEPGRLVAEVCPANAARISASAALFPGLEGFAKSINQRILSLRSTWQGKVGTWLKCDKDRWLSDPPSLRPATQMKSPGRGDRGFKDGRRGGVSGDASVQSKSDLFTLTAARRWRLLVQSPRIAALFQLRDGVIGDRVSLLFSQPFFQATDDLAGAPQCEGNCVPKDFSSSSH